MNTPSRRNQPVYDSLDDDLLSEAFDALDEEMMASLDEYEGIYPHSSILGVRDTETEQPTNKENG